MRLIIRFVLHSKYLGQPADHKASCSIARSLQIFEAQTNRTMVAKHKLTIETLANYR